jgi:hypothetical protein
MLSVAFYLLFAECRFAEYCFAECSYAECSYAEFSYAECRSAKFSCHFFYLKGCKYFDKPSSYLKRQILKEPYKYRGAYATKHFKVELHVGAK